MKTKEEKEVVDKYKTKDTSAKIALLGFFTALLIFLFAVSSASAAEYHVHEGESIQAAINMANPGDTIIVHNGTYTENVVVNKSDILIRSANGSAVTIVQSNSTDTHVFNITDQNNVTLEGFTIRDASATPSMTKGLIAMSLSALVLPPEYQKGKIKVTSEPSGATICLETPDGPFVGPIVTTPYTFDKVSVGYSTIYLSLNGYQDWSKRVHVKAGETTYVHAILTPTTGSIRITSTPSGATIYVDTYLGWSHKGKTPNTITGVSPDYYTIKLSLTGYQDWTKKIHVAAGETAHIHATMSQASGSISVTSSPSGATIYMDNKYRGKTPHTITAVSPGYHILKLTLADYLDWSKEVHVTAGETAQIHATMIEATGSILVTSTPSDALIYLDDQYRGKTPYTITAVSPGYHILKLTLADYLDWSKEVHVTAGETAHIHATMIKATGSISVTSTPADVKIYLDDRYRGKTPHRVTEVSPGYHTLRLTLDGYLDWSTNLQVRAGETSDVAAIMLTSFTQAGIYMNNASNCVIKNNSIINCGQGILIVSGCSNIIERNIIRAILYSGVRLESGAITTGIHENCFIDNVPQAWDDGTDNNWIGNYWSPPPGGSSNYIIPGAAGSEDKDPLDECPMTEQST